jgi:GrpB-like predicted nucleotidyltransferase (UPF0157 family)
MLEIVPYNPAWPLEFQRLRDSLAAALGALALRIDHIGSTAVPGLGAKDILDVQVTVLALAPEIVERLSAAGYEYRPDITCDHVPAGAEPAPELWTKLYFTHIPGQRAAHIHVRAAGRPHQLYPLLFRDYLRAHPHSAATVERIKRALVKYHTDDVDAYYDIKDPVYDLIWEAAREWAETTGWESAGDILEP